MNTYAWYRNYWKYHTLDTEVVSASDQESLFIVERITKSLLVHPEISQKKKSMMYMILRRTTALLILAAAAVLMPAACAEEASVESERNELRAFMVKSCSDYYPIGQGKCNML